MLLKDPDKLACIEKDRSRVIIRMDPDDAIPEVLVKEEDHILSAVIEK